MSRNIDTNISFVYSMYGDKHMIFTKNFSNFRVFQPPSWISQNAQGWEFHTHLDLIIYNSESNNQQRKKVYQRILG